jgi:hypothetical protein
MSDTIEMFNGLKAYKKEKKAGNRAQSAEILSRSGCVFESKNGGAHLIVLAGADVVDFWPGTGLWIVRSTKQQRRGVRKLVDFVLSSREGAA